ncbi:ribonuclease Z, mitochondrial isoform X2 [Anoplolepis gracilipes]
MPGILLTIQNAGVPEINIHGPKGTVEIFDAIKKFVMLQTLKVHEAKCDESKLYTDSVMSVSYVSITKSSAQEKESVNIKNEMIDINNTNSNGKRVCDNVVENERKTQKVEQKSDKTKISSAMSYICRLNPRRGTLCLEKCVEKGVTPGPLLGQLKAGQDITLPDGTVVLSKDVCSPTIPGPIFLIVDCPMEDYLESFVNHPAFAQHQTTASNENDTPYCIIHFTPQRVMDDPRYIDWMRKFDDSTRHLVVNEENECMGTEAVHRHQYKLHMLHSKIFPLLNEKSFQKNKRPKDLPIIHRSRTNHTIYLQPELRFDTNNEVMLHPEEYAKEVYDIEGFSEMLKDLQITINIQTERLSIKKEYPEIIMLGTGSSIPSKVRNTSGILLRIDKNHSMLLDCGEGTFGQIAKNYGKHKVDEIIKTVKAVYISHPHADHHMGLIGFLKEREKVTKDSLYLFAPMSIGMWLRLYHIRFEHILDQINLIPNSELFMDIHEPKKRYNYINMYETLNVQAVRTTLVNHCPNAYGVSVTLRNGKKIVYSGDTMPCESLVKLGQDCDLLIHEATMEDDLANEAKIKTHSTTSQAIQAGEQMRSKFTLLTHFSQRYPVIPPLPTDNSSKLNNVGIAYDNMCINLSQLPLLPLMYPTLKLMFIKYYTEIEERTAKRRMIMDL